MNRRSQGKQNEGFTEIALFRHLRGAFWDLSHVVPGGNVPYYVADPEKPSLKMTADPENKPCETLGKVIWLTAHFGEFDHTRDTWHAVNLSLMTTAGVAWESLVSNPITKTVITPYVNPNGVGDAAEWVQVTVEYEIPEGHALIDEQFTWGFTATKPSNGIAFFAAFDAATLEFEAFVIPEPSTALLCGLGSLLFLRRRR